MADETVEKSDPALKCGIVRPIAEMDGYSAQHWSDVHTIMTETLTSVGFDVRLVSDADEVGVIQGRIVKNLYEADLVVCDVSGKNPNVMLELGMRLAFDKPTIVIKDDTTAYSFDTSPIEHIPYPRDLRYNAILEFKEQLARKSVATVKAPSVEGYKSFLQHFGPIQVPILDRQEVSTENFILSELRDLKALISRPTKVVTASSLRPITPMLQHDGLRVLIQGLNLPQIKTATRMIGELAGVERAIFNLGGLDKSIVIEFSNDASPARRRAIEFEANEIVKSLGGLIEP